MFNGGAAPPERGQFLDFLRSAESKTYPVFCNLQPNSWRRRLRWRWLGKL
jgi:hypothetical protein